MAEVTLATANERQVWEKKNYREYIRKSGYLPYMGKSPMSIIHVKYEMQDEAGKTINIPLVTRLKGNGVTGSTALDGSEEDIGNFNCPISIDWRRHGVRVPKSTSYKTEMDLWGQAKPLLSEWEAEKLRDDITASMLSVELGVSYSASSAANRNTWLTSNTDRVLYGASVANAVSGVHATALALVDTAADKMSTTIAELGKRMAKNADPHIRPYKTEDGREFFVHFMGSRNFRDLKLDTAMIAANRDARAREGMGMDKNPLFQDGDLIKDGIIYREVPEIDAYASAQGFDGVGGAAADVRPSFLCGAQALGIAWGQEPKFQTDLEKDYKFRPGVAIEELLGVRKLFYASGAGGVNKQHGMVTIFTAAAADS